MKTVAVAGLGNNPTRSGIVPKFANIAAASSGDNVLVSGVTSKKLRVVSVFLMAAGDVDAYFVDGGDTALCGDATNKLDLTANGGFALNENAFGWFETTAGDSLDINLSAAVAVAGCLTYIEVD